MRTWTTLGVWLLLLTPLVVGLVAVETFSPPTRAVAADADIISLKDQLTVVLKPRTDAERAYVVYVVGKVDAGDIPVGIVNAAFTYSRTRKPYPFPYFRRVLPAIASQAGYSIN